MSYRMTSTSFNVGMSSDRSSSKATSSSSDSESDEDYVPSIKELKDEANDDDAGSMDENSDDSNGSDEATSSVGGVKRRRRKLERTKKRTKPCDEVEPDKDDESPKKEPSKNIDDIWHAFKKDVESERVKKPANVDPQNPETQPEPEKTEPEKPKTKTVKELFEFAGEAIEVEKEVPVDAPEPTSAPLPPKNIPTTSAPGPRKAPGGLSSILGQIGKKNKLSILEKSKLDWNSFKKQEGIEEQLQTHNKGKDGFLEKQDFLQRTDLRRFEIEKAMRSSTRKSK